MEVYIDKEYKCHLKFIDGYREFNIPFFDNKSSVVIEGYRYIPTDEEWIDDHGIVYEGELLIPFRDMLFLNEIQKAVDIALGEADDELAALIEQIYQEDVEMIENV